MDSPQVNVTSDSVTAESLGARRIGHTPGPWATEDWMVCATDAEASYICEVHPWSADPEYEAEARCNLLAISAAPETLHCTELLESLCVWLLHRFGPNSPEGEEALFRLESARDALFKATGA